MAEQTQGIRMDSSIDINIPVDQAFKFWKSLENFPKFMKHINTVQATGDNRYHWKADAPLGATISWDAVTTDVTTNKRIAWKSVEGSQLANAGSVDFSSLPSGGTRLHVQLSYDPPAGKLGHAIATLFGVNPEQQMQEDLARCKKMLESGGIEGVATRGEVEHAPAHKPH
ncbi:MAG: SRPBCC family protein [Deltaproteobacteria bacterium]|nr:MAG: SRPBCC family protein [Deltaproteobacteria bacterium]